MKTRIIWTKIYEDSWFSTLTLDEKFVFIYLFTNQRIGHTGIYELPQRVVEFEIGIENSHYKKMKVKFEKASKVFFYEDWIFIPNAAHYGGYSGPRNKTAYENERKSIPLKVIEAFKVKRDSV